MHIYSIGYIFNNDLQRRLVVADGGKVTVEWLKLQCVSLVLLPFSLTQLSREQHDKSSRK